MATDRIAAKLLSDLKRDFGLTDAQAAGVVGNLMYESGGFQQLQELNPTVQGSDGGYGYAQWTGPRRDAFEAYAKDRGLEPGSYEANYGYLKHELETNPYERRQFNTVKKAQTAAEAARLVSDNFLRPGKPNLSARTQLATQALGYAGMPVPPGEIPQVASMMDTVRRSPVPATISPTSAAVRSMTSPTGGNSGLQSALEAYAARERNRVQPASADDRVTARNRAWIANNPATETTVASIPTTRSLTQPGAVNGSVNSLSQDPTLAAALARRNAFSGDPGTPSNGPVVASIPTRAVPPVSRAPISYAGQDGARSLFSGDPGIPARGQVVSSIPTSNIGQKPATRSVQSVAVPPRTSASSSANITQARNEQMATRAPAVRPTNTVPQRYAGQDRANPVNVLPNRAQLEAATPFSVPQSAPFSYNPYAPIPNRLTPNALPVDPFAAAVAPLTRKLPPLAQPGSQYQVPMPRVRPNVQQPIQQTQQPAQRFAPTPFTRPFGLGGGVPARAAPAAAQPLRIVVNGGSAVPARSAPLQLAGYVNDGNGKLTSTATGGVYYERHLNR